MCVIIFFILNILGGCLQCFSVLSVILAAGLEFFIAQQFTGTITTTCLDLKTKTKTFKKLSNSYISGTKERNQKKRDYVGKIPKWPTPPSSLGNPCYQKKKLGLFFILGHQKHFWSSPKNHHFG